MADLVVGMTPARTGSAGVAPTHAAEDGDDPRAYGECAPYLTATILRWG